MDMKNPFLKLAAAIALLFVSTSTLTSQTVDPVWLRKQWKALWITVPEASTDGYGVYLFRKSFDLTSVPDSFVVHVSADNRYKLYVNGQLVSLGPARGDVLHWNFESVDLTPYLRVGNNVVSAQVWNDGESRPTANISLRTGFILQGNTEETYLLNTGATWKCIQDKSYHPTMVDLKTKYVAGPGEYIDMEKHICGWKASGFDDHSWEKAQVITPGYPKNKIAYGGPEGWMLMPSILPQMEIKPERLAHVCKSAGVILPKSFPASKVPVTIPANTVATLLLDQSHLTNAYPTLIFSEGKGGSITLRYAEALYTSYPAKDNRNEVDGKVFIGRVDSIVPNGNKNQEFTSLSWRTFRYIELKVVTKNAPLVLEDIYGSFTGYPFIMNARLDTDRKDLLKILEIGWRTARLCAVDTYMDCPYYEQLQYVGDTRIQAVVSMYNSGDDRLVKNALNQFDYSRQPEGIVLSRYPASIPQYIPPYSLWYVGMLHDYMMYGKDTDFVKDKLFGVRQMLNYFQKYQQSDGSLKNLPWWNFTDWAPKWPLGVRKFGEDGTSAVLDLQLLWAYQLAADMEQQIGMKEFSGLYQQKAESLKETIRNKYWDSTRNMFADRAEKDLFSQHTNSLAILTGVVSGEEATAISNLMLSDDELSQASIYFKYYLHLALVKAGLGNDYLNWLGTWYEYMNLGLTTWGETYEVKSTRSDCHAWGSSPNIEFFRTILGIDSKAPGFKEVRIEPHLGLLKAIGGEMPHPQGSIKVNYKLATNGQLTAMIQLPVGVTGVFLWKGKELPLNEGNNNFKIEK